MAADGRIARHVIAVNLAHMAALVQAGEVDGAVGGKIAKFLLSASPDIDPDSRPRTSTSSSNSRPSTPWA